MTRELRVECRRAPHTLWRALAATVLVMAGAVLAHTWAGGSVPTLPGLALVSAVVLAGGLAVLGRSTSILVLLPAVAVAQLALHETFGLVGEHAHQVAMADGGGWTGRMVLAHVGVTLLTGLAWWTGQRAAVVVVRLFARFLPPVLGPHQPRRTAARKLSSREAYLAASPRRGPPQVVHLT